ncbi:hypothetical protein [Thermovenabulum gondwanense]|uniref:Uncharacterized protein n=1 Tax=Thermovenabulum gondwanense TaxID=520767 RepID=A0A162MRF8_9FIRM|nr:hypothetical protein [Thermovenabulum gondwanense]KYO67002.1 hypothetical protein ATZ99_08190 [Thermovenabulum gondwanense]
MELKKFIVDFTIEMLYNVEKDELSIIETRPNVVKVETVNTKHTIEHYVTDAEIKYGILLLGAKNEVGSNIPLDTEITVKLNGNNFGKAKSHKKIKGRVDRLKRIFNLIIGDLIRNDSKITVSFDLESNTLEIITKKGGDKI